MSDPIDTLRLVEQAVRAPSSHNTQPWLFRVSRSAVELHADRTRALPVNDPYDRELTISCGAALLNLQVAAAQAGLGAETTLLPEPGDPDHLATVTLGGRPNSARVQLANPIEDRRTTREAFEVRAIPVGLAAELSALVERDGTCWLMRLENGPKREEVAQLVAEGDRTQFADPRWRRELASWMHPRRKADGLTVPAVIAPVSRAVVRTFDLGKSTGHKDHQLAMDAPLLAVLGSQRDDVETWIRTGCVLQEMLLRAAAHDVQVGYLNQPCQVAEVRLRLQSSLGCPGFPQLVMRFGHAPTASRRSPRRPVEDVLLDGLDRARPHGPA